MGVLLQRDLSAAPRVSTTHFLVGVRSRRALLKGKMAGALDGLDEDVERISLPLTAADLPLSREHGASPHRWAYGAAEDRR